MSIKKMLIFSTSMFLDMQTQNDLLLYQYYSKKKSIKTLLNKRQLKSRAKAKRAKKARKVQRK